MRRNVWLTRWRSEDGSGEEQEPSNGRRGSGLLAWKRNGWRKSGQKERRQDKREPSAFNPASPLSHGLF